MRPETLEWVEIAEGDFQTANREAAVINAPNFNAVCFHCQQSAEKYLKAVLTEHSIYFPKTHDLEILLASVCKIAPEATSLSQAAKALTGYGIDVRYPGGGPDSNAARGALSDCTAIRTLLRRLLGLLL
jgi:HEPN domain-containing protein